MLIRTFINHFMNFVDAKDLHLSFFIKFISVI
jgi:hypothetical protein